MEGKRDGVHWRGLWRVYARFAYMVLVKESAVWYLGSDSGGARCALPSVGAGWKMWNFVMKCCFFKQNFLPESGSQAPRRRKIENKHILFRYTDKSAELCILITSKATAICETIITMTRSKGMWTF